MKQAENKSEKMKYRLAEAMKICMKKMPVEKITVKEHKPLPEERLNNLENKKETIPEKKKKFLWKKQFFPGSTTFIFL